MGPRLLFSSVSPQSLVVAETHITYKQYCVNVMKTVSLTEPAK
jgi:hypothetical protein